MKENMKETLQRTVVLGWSDISFAGCRAVLGCKFEHSKLDLSHPTLDINQQTSQVKYEEEDVPTASIASCKEKEISMIAISSCLNTSYFAHIFDRVLDLCSSSNVKELVIVAALQIKVKPTENADVYQIAVNCKAVDSIPSIPDNFLIKDSALNMLIQLIQVEGIPMRCFVTQGYKIGSGKPKDRDGSKQSIESLQNILQKLYRVEFDKERTDSLEYTEGKNKGSPSLMYM